MSISVYLWENGMKFPGGAALIPGFGFTEGGLWRARPVPAGTAGLIVDDRFPPDRRGLAAARQALAERKELLIFDFERPPSPLLAELLRALGGKRAVLPPAWAALPHAAVLIGPWTGERPFPRWLEAQRNCYGRVILDGAPLRAAAAPGGPRRLWEGPLPEQGFPCPGLGCLHRRLEDGTVLFWDTAQTLSARLAAAEVPAVVFRADWDPPEI